MVKRRVAIQRRASGQSADGQLSESWNNLYETGAYIKQTLVNETVNEELEISSTRIEVKIPYSSNALTIRSDDAVLVNTIRYDIDGIDTDTFWRKYVVLTCTQRRER